MARVFRIVSARTETPGEFRATTSIPSPGANEMAEALKDPVAHRKRTVEYERDVIQTRNIPRATPVTGAPGTPDLLGEIKKQRGAK
jgi:hypothetical protein